VYAFLKPCRLTDACATCGVLLRPCPIVARGFAVIQFGTDMAHQYANGGDIDRCVAHWCTGKSLPLN
jgi:hypothetical protein